MSMCNDYFYEFRESKSLLPVSVQNIFITKKKLKNIWDRKGIVEPTGFA